ncbi:MAG: hypothetical protein GF409_03595 [Candidatus Omnitrophica bacterium]|nr:hypothetical protein [Candidatus Omnitrophota bacterium]
MEKIIRSFVLVCFLVSVFACCRAGAIDVYTFKKKRVDQNLDGNRGYLMGKPQDMKGGERNVKRTLIGVDIELPAGSSYTEDESRETAVPDEGKKQDKPSTTIKDESEEDWIK